MRSEIEHCIAKTASGRDKARGAYLAICLDFAGEFKGRYPAQWTAAVTALAGFSRVVQTIFNEAPIPAGDRIRERALAAGLRGPAAR